MSTYRGLKTPNSDSLGAGPSCEKAHEGEHRDHRWDDHGRAAIGGCDHGSSLMSDRARKPISREIWTWM